LITQQGLETEPEDRRLCLDCLGKVFPPPGVIDLFLD
jgi:hypothetical protein